MATGKYFNWKTCATATIIACFIIAVLGYVFKRGISAIIMGRVNIVDGMSMSLIGDGHYYLKK